jgi:hypothetical protein
MKKISLSVLVCFVSLLSIAQSDISSNVSSLINTFLNSPEYRRVQQKILSLGNVDLSLSKVTYSDNNTTKPILNIAITNRGVVKGIVEAIPLPENAKTVLPQNDKYVMQLIDYSNYNVTTKTGVIKTFDLNYEAYLSAEVNVNNSSISSFAAYHIPADVVARHPADTNGNGNVGFGECMGYMQAACNGSAGCATMCTIVNLAGIGTSIGGQCTISMAAACIYLSIKY